MEVITKNPIIYDSGLVDDEYENAYGKRRSGLGRRGGRRGGSKRTGVNRAIGVIPVVAGARYLQRRKADREQGQRNSQSSPSGAKMRNPNLPTSNKQVGAMEFPTPASQSKPASQNSPISQGSPASQGKPSTRPPRGGLNPLQGKPNVQQDVAVTNAIAPTPNNNKKIALIVGGVLLLGVAVYFYKKKK